MPDINHCTDLKWRRVERPVKGREREIILPSHDASTVSYTARSDQRRISIASAVASTAYLLALGNYPNQGYPLREQELRKLVEEWKRLRGQYPEGYQP